MDSKVVKHWRQFMTLCEETATDHAMFAEMLNLFLTAEEKENISMRHMIIGELLRGEKTQRTIAETMGVSIAKITRGSNELKRMDKKLIAYLKEKI